MNGSCKLAVQITGVCLCAGLFAGSLWLVYGLTLGSMHTLAWNRYGFADLLINYGAGFLRRGLLGACIHWMSGSGPELPTANLIVFSNFALLVCTLTVMAVRKGRYGVWNAVLVLAVPGGVFAMGVAREFFYRKEIFFCSALAICGLAVSLMRGIRSRNLRTAGAGCVIGAIFALGVVLSLVHEGFLFLYAPANLFLLIAAVRLLDEPGKPEGVREPKLERRMALGFVSVTVAMFLYMGYIHGGPRTSEVIWQGLNPKDRAMMGPYDLSAIGWMQHSVAQLINEPVAVLVSGTAWFWTVPAIGLMLYSMALVALNEDAAGGFHEGRSKGADLFRWAKCYLTLLVASLPIFVMGRDWGRWINSVNLSFLILWLSLSADELAGFASACARRMRWIDSVRSRTKSSMSAYAGFVGRHRGGVVAGMLFFAMTFRFPESILEPSDPQYILYLGVHSIWRLLHHLGRG